MGASEFAKTNAHVPLKQEHQYEREETHLAEEEEISYGPPRIKF